MKKKKIETTHEHELYTLRSLHHIFVFICRVCIEISVYDIGRRWWTYLCVLLLLLNSQIEHSSASRMLVCLFNLVLYILSAITVGLPSTDNSFTYFGCCWAVTANLWITCQLYCSLYVLRLRLPLRKRFRRCETFRTHKITTAAAFEVKKVND